MSHSQDPRFYTLQDETRFRCSTLRTETFHFLHSWDEHETENFQDWDESETFQKRLETETFKTKADVYQLIRTLHSRAVKCTMVSIKQSSTYSSDNSTQCSVTENYLKQNLPKSNHFTSIGCIIILTVATIIISVRRRLRQQQYPSSSLLQICHRWLQRSSP